MIISINKNIVVDNEVTDMCLTSLNGVRINVNNPAGREDYIVLNLVEISAVLLTLFSKLSFSKK